MQVGENPAFYLNFWFPYMWAAELTLGCIPVQLNCERHLELTHRLLGMDASGEKFYFTKVLTLKTKQMNTQ